MGSFNFKCLTNKEIIGKEIARELLGSEHDGRRIIGLVDCTSEEQFDKELKVTKRQWPEAFTKWLHSSEGRLWPLFASMKKCMLRPVRVAAGLGNPPRQMAKPENRGIQHCYKRGDFQTKNWSGENTRSHWETRSAVLFRRAGQSHLSRWENIVCPQTIITLRWIHCSGHKWHLINATQKYKRSLAVSFPAERGMRPLLENCP